MKEIQRDNAVIDYHVEGNGDTTLLFVHGSYIDQSYWKDQVSYFNPEYTVVTLDLPGHGKSGKERSHWSLPGFAEDVNEVINVLNLKNVILIGHSAGAGINLMAASSRPAPVIGFIAIDYFKNAGAVLSPQFEQQAVAIEQQLKSDFANTNEQYARMALLTSQTSSEITNRVVNDYRNACQPMGIATTPEIFKIYQLERKLLPGLHLKLYLINVDYKPTNEEALKQYAVNGYQVFYLHGTCHYPMLEKPIQLNKLLEQAILAISSDNVR